MSRNDPSLVTQTDLGTHTGIVAKKGAINETGIAAPKSRITLKGIFTKKSLAGPKGGKAYTIMVNKGVKTVDIARALEKHFDVKVTEVRTLRHGKVRGFRKNAGPKVWKKAIVTVAEGDSLELLRNADEKRRKESALQSPERLAAIADYHRARRGVSTDAELAEILDVPRYRVAGWKTGTVTPSRDDARLLSHVAIVIGELGAFLDPDVIPDWLLSEQFRLGGKTPAEALRDGRLAEVLYAANATEHGAYT